MDTPRPGGPEPAAEARKIAMTEDSGGQQSNAPPQYSADGRWWWDGQQWISSQEAPDQRQYQSPPPPPSIDAPLGGSSGSQAAFAEVGTAEALAGGGQHHGTPQRAAGPEVSATAGWSLGLGIATILSSSLLEVTIALPDNPDLWCLC